MSLLQAGMRSSSIDLLSFLCPSMHSIVENDVSGLFTYVPRSLVIEARDIEHQAYTYT